MPSYTENLDGDVRGMKLGVPVEYMKHATGETADLIHKSIDELRGLGCDLAQGFPLGAPVEAEELAQRLMVPAIGSAVPR